MADFADVNPGFSSTSSEGEDNEAPRKLPAGSKFTPIQVAKLRALFEAGMKGVGRQYMGQIEQASAETGLS